MCHAANKITIPRTKHSTRLSPDTGQKPTSYCVPLPRKRSRCRNKQDAWTSLNHPTHWVYVHTTAQERHSVNWTDQDLHAWLRYSGLLSGSPAQDKGQS
jgi:hypothetical protein